MTTRVHEGQDAAELRVGPRARRTMLVVLVGAALVLAAMSVLRNVLLDAPPDWLERFNTANEANVPTWFTGALLLLSGAAAGLIAAAIPPSAAALRRGWWLVAAGLTYLSADEVGQLHEQFVGPAVDAVRSTTGLDGAAGRVVSAALVLVVFAVLVLVLRPWLTRLRDATLRGLVVAGAVYVTGALGLEVVSRMVETADLVSGTDFDAGLSVVEELLEMTGASLVLVCVIAELGALGVLVRSTADRLPAGADDDRRSSDEREGVHVA